MKRKCLGAIVALLQVLSVQCSKSEYAIQPENQNENTPETVVTKFTVKGRFRRCELFIYRCDALGAIAAHRSWMPPANGSKVNDNEENYSKANDESTELSAFIRLEKGRYRAVAVCNACSPVNPAAVARVDAFDGFSYSYADENPQYPFCSAALEFEAGEQVRINPRRLMCTVHLVSVRREFQGEDAKAVIERPVIFLTNVPAKCEVLREHTFQPSEFLETDIGNRLMYQSLGRDLGYEELRPDIKLYCYPNDSAQEDIASAHTKIVLEGRIDGMYCQWEKSLGAMERGCEKNVEFVLKSKSECICLIY